MWKPFKKLYDFKNDKHSSLQTFFMKNIRINSLKYLNNNNLDIEFLNRF